MPRHDAGLTEPFDRHRLPFEAAGGRLAWVFGVYPPAWQRVLIVALTVAAVAAVAALDDLKARYVQYPRYDKAA